MVWFGFPLPVTRGRAGQAAAMAGMAEALAKERAAALGAGRHGHAVPYLGQRFGALRQECLQAGRLFHDPSFPAGPAALGYNELGPSSFKTRGVEWRRPTVGASPGWVPAGWVPPRCCGCSDAGLAVVPRSCVPARSS